MGWNIKFVHATWIVSSTGLLLFSLIGRILNVWPVFAFTVRCRGKTVKNLKTESYELLYQLPPKKKKTESNENAISGFVDSDVGFL